MTDKDKNNCSDSFNLKESFDHVPGVFDLVNEVIPGFKGLPLFDPKSACLDGLIIAVDFDGTCVTHKYPDIGEDIGAQEALRDFSECGAKLILWTMRHGPHLEAACEWFKKNSIPLYGVNQNPDQHWSSSPKAYAHIYIDDSALGAPLVYKENGERPHIDWKAIRDIIYLNR